MASTNSRPLEHDDARGAQRPRLCHIAPYVESTGDEAIALAAMAGLHLDDWQQFVLRESLGERPDGRWVAKTVGLCVPRQNGKGSILEARELAGLFLLDEQLIIHTAHLQKTATSHFRRLRNLIKRVPEFESRVVSAPTGKGSEAIHLDTGQTIFFATRSGGGGRGLTADLIVYDEAMYLSEQDRSSLAPTMAARSMDGNIQTWYAGSAVDQLDPAHDGVPFAQVRQRGIDGAKGVTYFEWSAEGDDPDAIPAAVAADPTVQAVANPSRGIRISAEWIEHERTVELGPRGFAVERLGIGDWPDITDASLRVISSEKWQAARCTDESKRIEGVRTFAADVNPSRTWGAICVAGRRDDDLLHFATVVHLRGTGWMLERMEALHADDPDAVFVMDPRGPAASLIEPMKEAGLEVIETSTRDYANACGGFFDLIDQERGKYPVPQPDLDEAVASARTTTLGDAWKWAPRSSTSADITPLVAATLAIWGAETHTPADPVPLIAWR